MKKLIEEITEEEYLRSKDSPDDFREEVYENIPMIWNAGYGYYGFTTYKENGKYYISHTLGDSCD